MGKDKKFGNKKSAIPKTSQYQKVSAGRAQEEIAKELADFNKIPDDKNKK